MTRLSKIAGGAAVALALAGAGVAAPASGAGTANEVIDHQAGTRTVRGDIARGTQPGRGTFFKESGQIVFAGGPGNVAFAAGRHDAIAFGGINGALCAALADA